MKKEPLASIRSVLHGRTPKIIYLIENPELSKIIEQRGRTKIEAMFSSDVMIDGLEKLYKNIIKSIFIFQKTHFIV